MYLCTLLESLGIKIWCLVGYVMIMLSALKPDTQVVMIGCVSGDSPPGPRADIGVSI